MTLLQSKLLDDTTSHLKNNQINYFNTLYYFILLLLFVKEHLDKLIFFIPISYFYF